MPINPDLVKSGDRVTLTHPDGSRLPNQKLDGTGRWVHPGGTSLSDLDALLQSGWVLSAHTPQWPAGLYLLNDYVLVIVEEDQSMSVGGTSWPGPKGDDTMVRLVVANEIASWMSTTSWSPTARIHDIVAAIDERYHGRRA